jgi:hypothetical protein
LQNTEYDIFELNQKYGDKLTFSSNLSPTLLATGRISEIESYAKNLILELALGGDIFLIQEIVLTPLSLLRIVKCCKT